MSLNVIHYIVSYILSADIFLNESHIKIYFNLYLFMHIDVAVQHAAKTLHSSQNIQINHNLMSTVSFPTGSNRSYPYPPR